VVLASGRSQETLPPLLLRGGGTGLPKAFAAAAAAAAAGGATAAAKYACACCCGCCTLALAWCRILSLRRARLLAVCSSKRTQPPPVLPPPAAVPPLAVGLSTSGFKPSIALQQAEQQWQV
jgi:hypothetical protein